MTGSIERPVPAERLSDDASVAQRILAHIRHGTTDRGDEVWREPAANYGSAGRLAAELRMMRRFPTPFCPSAALAGQGAFVAREAAGVPIVAVRQGDGSVRAFRNACRHRGMPVADGSGCSRAFVCRYHGWTYALSGELRHIPHEDGFPGLDKARHGLVPVCAEERHGMVFVTQDLPAVADGSLDPLPEIVTPDQTLFGVRQADTEANWKILAEGFIEGYHIKATHPTSFLPYGYDNLNLVDVFGRSSRVTYPFRRIERLAGVPPAERRVQGLLTHVYHLFPNVMVSILSSHTNVTVLEPLAVDRTRVISYQLTNPGVDEAAAQRDAAFVGTTGAEEDRAVARAIQRGLASGANESFVFGHFEKAIVNFHRSLDLALAE